MSWGQEIIDYFWEIFMESESMKINIEHVKINLFQVGVKNFIRVMLYMVNCKFFSSDINQTHIDCAFEFAPHHFYYERKER